MNCVVCGWSEFSDQIVLWPGLVAEWGLSDDEAAYVNRQQGTHCSRCGASLRHSALTLAILGVIAPGYRTLDAYLRSRARWRGLHPHRGLRILDLNGADVVSPRLAQLRGYERHDFPEQDMQAMTFADGTFDLVIHADSLEHIPDPETALAECRRVLKPGGALCYTIPMVIGRLTESRQGKPPSYHGNPETDAADWAVQTEFGADFWTWPARAGFGRVSIVSMEYPAAFGITAFPATVAD